MRARACFRCHQYIYILPEEAQNQLALSRFENDHIGHGLLTEDIEELKGRYTDVNHLYSFINRKIGTVS